MIRKFHIIQLQLEKGALKRLQNRQRHQLVGWMHAHNELAFLNRLLLLRLCQFNLCALEFQVACNWDYR